MCKNWVVQCTKKAQMGVQLLFEQCQGEIVVRRISSFDECAVFWVCYEMLSNKVILYECSTVVEIDHVRKR